MCCFVAISCIVSVLFLSFVPWINVGQTLDLSSGAKMFLLTPSLLFEF
jgi:hypothetical protein